MPLHASDWTPPLSWLWQSSTQSKAWSPGACVRWPLYGFPFHRTTKGAVKHEVVWPSYMARDSALKLLKNPEKFHSHNPLFLAQVRSNNFEPIFFLFGSEWGGRKMWRLQMKGCDLLLEFQIGQRQGRRAKGTHDATHVNWRWEMLGTFYFNFNFELFQGIVEFIRQWLKQP